ncbi:hypothetical protein, partial [Bradyrhizobium liaoningense]|uniref:hypothetical protein n=1 Tax=Bradyrhizobium liaoningense TaxID=43992 RepID=UPI001BA8994C
MSMDPADLWSTLTPALRRQIVEDVAAILAEIPHEVRAGHTKPLGAQSRSLHPAVDAPSGR